jgi:hypothetical protein
LYLAVCAICGAAFVVLHVVCFRLWKVRSINRTCGLIAAVAGAAGGAVGWVAAGPLFSSEGTRLLGSVAGALTSVGFAIFYTLIGPVSADRSISAHMVMHFLEEPSHSLTETELARLYPPEEVFRKRFGECIDVGVLTQEGERYRLTSKGVRIARFFRSMVSLLRIEIVG